VVGPIGRACGVRHPNDTAVRHDGPEDRRSGTMIGIRSLLAIAILGAAGAQPVSALEVWTESPIVFNKTGPHTIPANQDRITANVWLTRGFTRGLYNIARESSYQVASSPIGTRWAFAGLNGNPTTISAADFAELTFDSWETSLGGEGVLRDHIIDRAGVVHLIEDDIYIDIRFGDWGTGGSGTFRYTRATEPAAAPAPLSSPLPLALLVAALVATGSFTARNRIRARDGLPL
jgi:hypothetical protein